MIGVQNYNKKTRPASIRSRFLPIYIFCKPVVMAVTTFFSPAYLRLVVIGHGDAIVNIAGVAGWYDLL